LSYNKTTLAAFTVWLAILSGLLAGFLGGLSKIEVF
jgi:hypothetical protein